MLAGDRRQREPLALGGGMVFALSQCGGQEWARLRRRSREVVMSLALSIARTLRPSLFARLMFFFAIAASGGAHAQTPIRFLLDWKIDGTSAPFLLAVDKGYFKAEGLNVGILEPVSFDPCGSPCSRRVRLTPSPACRFPPISTSKIAAFPPTTSP